MLDNVEWELKQKTMNRQTIFYIILFTILILIVVGGLYFLYRNDEGEVAVNSFEECALAGYQIREVYPPVCVTPAGEEFVMEILNEGGEEMNGDGEDKSSKNDLIRIRKPEEGELVRSPLAVEGEARGNWFFEATFPIVVEDEMGNMLGQSFATAGGEWMTTEFVPFSGEVEFEVPEGVKRGVIIFKKDNPSGLPENEDEVRVLVNF